MARKRSIPELRSALEVLASSPRRDSDLVPELVDLYVELMDAEDDVVDEGRMLEYITTQIGREAVPPLLKVFHSGEPDERIAAIAMLGMVGQPGDAEIAEVARTAVNDNDTILRDTAVRVFAVVASASDLDDLLSLMDTEQPTSFLIISALARLGGPTAIEALDSMLYRAGGMMTTHDVVGALERIGTPESIQAIRDWRASDSGKEFVEQRASDKMQVFVSYRPPSGWVQEQLYDPDVEVMREQSALFRDITRLALKKLLRNQFTSAWVAHDLEHSGIPDALQILKEWHDEGGG